MKKRHAYQHKEFDNEENLGLDADHSSSDWEKPGLNDDNDRVSGNPDGENDNKKIQLEPGDSPLEDK